MAESCPSGPYPVEFHAVLSEAAWKVGLDLGSQQTRLHDLTLETDGRALARASHLPTLIGWEPPSEGVAGPARPAAIGLEAIRRKDELRLQSPFSTPPEERAGALKAFAEALRQDLLAHHPGKPWGVIACPAGAATEVRDELRAVGEELFDRLLLVDEPHLLSLGILADPLASYAVVADIGATAIRCSLAGGLAEGTSLEAGALPRFRTAKGGDAVDAHLKAALHGQFPDHAITDRTIRAMKEKLSFVPPETRCARVKVSLGGAERVVDLTPLLREACEILVPPLVESIRGVLLASPKELLEKSIREVHLAGGGAMMPGLPRRIEEELARCGFERLSVHVPENPRGRIALGALRLGLVTPDPDWVMVEELMRRTG